MKRGSVAVDDKMVIGRTCSRYLIVCLTQNIPDCWKQVNIPKDTKQS